MRLKNIPGIALVTVLVLALGACSWGLSATDTSADASSSSSSDESSTLTTKNVNYIGTVEELGVSIYQQGTHKLTLGDGSEVLLESSELNLDAYVGRRVEVHGSVEATVEAGGTIMHVGSVTVLDEASSSKARELPTGEGQFCGGFAAMQCPEGFICIDNPGDDCDPENGGADCGGICTAKSSSSSSAKTSVLSSSAVAVVSPSSSSSSSTSQAVTISASQSAMAGVMAKQKYDAPLWTQKYCTGYIGFCVPAHKNWYYKSFGATTATLWRVEFGLEAIEELGQGAIVLNLVSGTSASSGGVDGQLKTQGSDVVGFKDWTNGKHFEITADARLSAVVEYMLSHLVSYVPAE